MPLAFTVPLTPHEQAILASLPKLQGAVLCPDYWPKHERVRGEREFLAWCEAHERRDFPQWLNDWEIRFRLTHRGAQRSASEGDDAQAVGRADQERAVAG